jgi:hypothetical protein
VSEKGSERRKKKKTRWTSEGQRKKPNNSKLFAFDWTAQYVRTESEERRMRKKVKENKKGHGRGGKTKKRRCRA